MSIPKTSSIVLGISRNTVDLIINGDEVIMRLLCDVAGLDPLRREVLMAKSLQAVLAVQREVECMDESEAQKLIEQWDERDNRMYAEQQPISDPS